MLISQLLSRSNRGVAVVETPRRRHQQPYTAREGGERRGKESWRNHTDSQERVLTHVRTIWPGGKKYACDAPTQLLCITTVCSTYRYGLGCTKNCARWPLILRRMFHFSIVIYGTSLINTGRPHNNHLAPLTLTSNYAVWLSGPGMAGWKSAKGFHPLMSPRQTLR